MYDLVIRGGRIVDPTQGIDQIGDVAIAGGRIAAVGRDLETGAAEVLDASGLVVTPGLIDLHSHVFWGVAPLGVEPDPHCLARGVTTAVDAGSSGSSTFPAFRRFIIEVAATRILAFVHIASIGMARDDARGSEAVGELEDLRWADVNGAIEIGKANPDVVVGVKVRLGRGQIGPDPRQCREGLTLALRAAEGMGKPVMVHIGSTPAPLDELLEMLRPGDVVTHCFHGHAEGILDANGRVKATVRAAIERGVVFDVGHGMGSFSFGVARAALEQGLLPGTISSDIHTWSVTGPSYDLATTATKFLHLGVPLPEVIRRITTNPARAIDLADRLGTLAPGAEGDVSVFRLAEGTWPLRDAMGVTEIGKLRLEPVWVVRAGRVYACNPAVYQSPPSQPA